MVIQSILLVDQRTKSCLRSLLKYDCSINSVCQMDSFWRLLSWYLMSLHLASRLSVESSQLEFTHFKLLTEIFQEIFRNYLLFGSLSETFEGPAIHFISISLIWRWPAGFFLNLETGWLTSEKKYNPWDVLLLALILVFLTVSYGSLFSLVLDHKGECFCFFVKQWSSALK